MYQIDTRGRGASAVGSSISNSNSSAANASVILPFSAQELERMARKEYQDPPLQKTKGEHARWYIRIRKRILAENGVGNSDGNGVRRIQTREYLGRVADMGVRDAQRARKDKLVEVNGQLGTVSSQVMMTKFVSLYLSKHLPSLGSATQEKYRSLLKNHVLPAWGRCRLCDVRCEDLQAWMNRKRDQGLSWWVRSDLKNLISALFTKAEDWGYWTERNPARKVGIGRKEWRRERRLLTDEQVVRLLEALPAVVGLVLKLVDSTGCRISEALGLRWASVDLETGWITIRERYRRGDLDQTKSEAGNRQLALGDLAEEFRDVYRFSEFTRPDSYVFCDRKGRPLDDRGIHQHFLRKAAKNLGFYWKGFGFHSFRRGQITKLLASGASSIEVAKIAGHSRPVVTFDYTQMEKDRQERLIKGHQSRLELVKKYKKIG